MLPILLLAAAAIAITARNKSPSSSSSASTQPPQQPQPGEEDGDGNQALSVATAYTSDSGPYFPLPEQPLGALCKVGPDRWGIAAEGQCNVIWDADTPAAVLQEIARLVSSGQFSQSSLCKAPSVMVNGELINPASAQLTYRVIESLWPSLASFIPANRSSMPGDTAPEWMEYLFHSVHGIVVFQYCGFAPVT